MKSFFRKPSSTPASKEVRVPQEKIATSVDSETPTNTTVSSSQDDSSKMSVSELTSISGNAPKQTPVFTEQPGLILASEDDTAPKPSSDKETVPGNGVSTNDNADKSRAYAAPPAYKEGSTASNPKDMKPDLLSQEILAPDSVEKEIALPQRSTSTDLLNRSFSQQQQSRTYREYSFYYTNAMTHLIICDPDSQAIFFAESSTFTRGKSDILIYDIANAPDNLSRRGSSLSYKEAMNAPIVASADFVQANNIKIGLGDPVQPESARWMMMRNTYNDAKRSIEKFEVLATDLDGTQGETLFQWNRGADDDEGTEARRSSDKINSKESFRMSRGNDLMASFRNASMTSIKKRGQLRVYESTVTDELMILTFVSFVSLCEKQRRRKVKKSLLMGM